MRGIGGALEPVDGQAERFPLAAELGGDQIRELLGALARGLGGPFHFLAVFVGAGGQDGVVAQHALEAADGVGGDGGISVADVRRRIHVVDRGRQIKLRFHEIAFR
jgi:hypothetical protein